MSDKREDWLNLSEQANSARRMYMLALTIAQSRGARREVKRAARRVVHLLRDIIDQPIADARVLSKARTKFNRLVAALRLP